MSISEKNYNYFSERDNTDKLYNTVSFTGFTESALMCQSPLDFQSYFMANLSESGIDGYDCPLSKLPYTDFPGWDDDKLQYSPACRDWFTDQIALPK